MRDIIANLLDAAVLGAEELTQLSREAHAEPYNEEAAADYASRATAAWEAIETARVFLPSIGEA